MRILLIEDNQATATSIQSIMKTEGYVCDATDLGEDGLEIAKLYDYDIIVLDLMLPDISGREVLSGLREAHVRTPVLILSGMDDINDKIDTFAGGADDYLAKPFSMSELVARVQAIVRRTRGLSGPVVQTGKLTVDMNAHTAQFDGQPISFTPKEYSIVELLSLHQGSTLTKPMFLDHLYGGEEEPELKIIDVYVCKIRNKIAKIAGGDNYIATDWGRGYVLNAPA